MTNGASVRRPSLPFHDHAHDHPAEQDEEAFPTLPDPLSITPAELLRRYETVNVLAPLVRCSKLPFRHLCSLYETHVTHTPMILAEEFSRSQTARVSDFSSSVNERGVFWLEPRKGGGSVNGSGSDGTRKWTAGRSNRLPHSLAPPTPRSELVRGLLIAQMASPNAASLADAAELISPYVDGVDLNCGCPQKWAYHEGIGCALLRKPELVGDMVRCAKDRLGWEYPVSIKIRIDPEPEYVESHMHQVVDLSRSTGLMPGQTDTDPGGQRYSHGREPHNDPRSDTTSSVDRTRQPPWTAVRGRVHEWQSPERRQW